jgi:hypothetical protein
MHKEEGFIYSLDTINNGALLQKNGEKPYLKCIVTDLSTLIESYNRKKQLTHSFKIMKALLTQKKSTTKK